MKGDGGATAVRMPELLVRSALPCLGEAHSFEYRHDLSRLKNRSIRHVSVHGDGLDTGELGFKYRIAILEKHLDDLLQIGP